MDLDQVLARSPDDVQALIDRGGVLLVLREYDAAIADLDLALRSRPDSPILLMNRGFARSALGDHAGAVADYELALQHAAPGSNEAARLAGRLEAERAKLQR